MSQVIQAVTETEEQQIRDEYAEFVVGTGQCCNRLHLPAKRKDEPRCQNSKLKERVYSPNQFNATGWKRKSVRVYPPGFHDLCKYCVQQWRQE